MLPLFWDIIKKGSKSSVCQSQRDKSRFSCYYQWHPLSKYTQLANQHAQTPPVTHALDIYIFRVTWSKVRILCGFQNTFPAFQTWERQPLLHVSQAKAGGGWQVMQKAQVSESHRAGQLCPQHPCWGGSITSSPAAKTSLVQLVGGTKAVEVVWVSGKRGQAWGWVGEIAAGGRGFMGGWLREREMTGEKVWKCRNSAWWGGREVSMLKGLCEGALDSEIAHLHIWVGYPGLKTPQSLQGERQDVYQALKLCGVGMEITGLNCNTIPWLRLGETYCWNSRKSKALARWVHLHHWRNRKLSRNRPASIHWGWNWYSLSWYWGQGVSLVTLLRSFSVIKQEQRREL